MNTRIMFVGMALAILGILNEVGAIDIALNVISQLEYLFLQVF